ncbi:MAG TPA: alkaline phosphatase D family protein [Pirellulales bacterium]|nr:alkaline phosphatase D family protein [Pirellulales bacterium]
MDGNSGSSRIDRRAFLYGTGSLAAAAIWSQRPSGIVRADARLFGYPFTLGVASGDPTSDGVVLWTRLAPRPFDGGGMPDEAVKVDWQVADDEAMTRVVRKGTTAALPEWGHSVHVEVDGLAPDRWYWYQFRAAGETSPKGRTRTAPAADARPERLRLAFASCQHFEAGLYTAYEHMLREDLDLVIHLGDYIYEYAAEQSHVRRHIGGELSSLVDYRNRHAQYKSDPALQAMHAAVPWIVTWDDHEVDNNYANAISEEKGVTPEEFLVRRAAGYQAYYEHMPLRRAALPKGADMLLYRRVPWGTLAEFFVLDTRQYRTDQPCGDGNKPPCDAMLDPNATLLGGPQRDWLFDGLDHSRSTWNVLAQQVMMARVDLALGETELHSMDQWPGYEVDRRRVLRHLYERKIANPVVLTGDIHNHWANDLLADFDDLGGPIVAAEFVGTSISSGGNGVDMPRSLKPALSENPFVKFINDRRGYVACTVSPNEWRTDYRTVEYVDRYGAPLTTPATFVVESGKPGLQKA